MVLAARTTGCRSFASGTRPESATVARQHRYRRDHPAEEIACRWSQRLNRLVEQAGVVARAAGVNGASAFKERDDPAEFQRLRGRENWHPAAVGI